MQSPTGRPNLGQNAFRLSYKELWRRELLNIRSSSNLIEKSATSLCLSIPKASHQWELGWPKLCRISCLRIIENSVCFFSLFWTWLMKCTRTQSFIIRAPHFLPPCTYIAPHRSAEEPICPLIPCGLPERVYHYRPCPKTVRALSGSNRSFLGALDTCVLRSCKSYQYSATILSDNFDCMKGDVVVSSYTESRGKDCGGSYAGI